MINFFSLLNKAYKLLLRKVEGVYYINGTDTLPPPLSPEEEAEVTARLAEDPNLKSYLVEHNLRLVVYISKKFDEDYAYELMRYNALKLIANEEI